MKIGTIVSQRCFNGMFSLEDTEKCLNCIKDNFSDIGMLAFGQMPYIAKGPNPETDYDFKNVDALVSWAVKNNINVCYNVVINPHKESFPDWYYDLSADDKKIVLERHVKTVVNRYKDRIKLYKLVNEAHPYPEENFLGTNEKKSVLIAQIFKWAKEVYPEGQFMLNDHFPFILEDEKTQKFLEMAKMVLDEGAPIDVIGIEGHLGYKPDPFQIPTDEAFNEVLEKVHEITNLPIYITEFDISWKNSSSEIDPNVPFTVRGVEYPNWFDYQAYAYKHFYELCQSKEFIKGLYFWGFAEKDRFDWERPDVGFFGKNFSPKPVYVEMKDIFLTNLLRKD